MKSFIELTEEQTKKLTMLFGRMNPPTIGHEENVEGLKKVAAKEGADHLVIASHSQDAKKNPLSPDVKLKHLKRAFPNTNITTSSKEKPTIMHHASEAYKKGYTHLHIIAGADRVPEYERLLKHYNGKFKDEAGAPLRHGGYHFKSIKVSSSGERKKGISGTDMRNHVTNNDFKSFAQHLPTALQQNPKQAKELFSDVRKGMGLKTTGKSKTNESVFKAIFVTGGPGSGKDIVVHNCIAESTAVEYNTKQAYDILHDKHGLSQNEAIRNRSPLIINGPADDQQRMLSIKEELEELGYDTLMVFVDTSNEISQERNERLTKSIAEEVRMEKWANAQSNKKTYSENFEYFLLFDNSASLSDIEESVTDTYQIINMFLEHKSYNDTAISWLERNGKIDINESFNLIFEEPNDKKNSKSIQKQTIVKYNPSYRAKSPADIKPDNRAGANPPGQADQIKGDTFPRKDPNGKGHSGGAWSGAYSTEETNQKISIRPLPKESKFSQDKDKLNKKKKGDSNVSEPRIGRPSGFSQEYDTRAGGQSAAAGAGLGQNLYGECLGPTASNGDVVNFAGQTRGVSVNPLDSQQPPKKKKTFKEFYGFQNDTESGVGGTLGGADNKEQMDSYRDPNRNVIIQTKKKKKQEK